jgi:putative ABC transport system permease protein
MAKNVFSLFLITVAAIIVLTVAATMLVGIFAPLLGNVPVSYNFRSIRARWTSTIVAIIGIAGTVGVFVAMLSLARGFRATLVSSGSAGNALVMRAGSTSEMMGGITLDTIKVIQDKPGIARGAPLVTQEVVGVIPVPLISTGTDANVQARGVSPNVLDIRKFVKIVEGRMFQPGLSELVVGKNAMKTYAGLTLGNKVDFAGGHWTVPPLIPKSGAIPRFSTRCFSVPRTSSSPPPSTWPRLPPSRNSRTLSLPIPKSMWMSGAKLTTTPSNPPP